MKKVILKFIKVDCLKILFGIDIANFANPNYLNFTTLPTHLLQFFTRPLYLLFGNQADLVTFLTEMCFFCVFVVQPSHATFLPRIDHLSHHLPY